MNRIGSSRRPANLSTAASSHRVFSATPSNTARTRSGRVTDRDRLWNPPRSSRSSTGVRSPYRHGVKITPLLPGGRGRGHLVQLAVADRRGTAAGQHPVARELSAALAVSCSLATRYRPGIGAGSAAMLCSRSVLLNGT